MKFFHMQTFEAYFQSLLNRQWCILMRVKKICYANSQKRRQTLKNNRPVSLLPICSKSFQYVIYNEMFGFFLYEGLILAN